MRNNHEKILKLVGVASIAAIVIVLQLLSLVVKIGPFAITLALIPIVVGAIIYGPLAGGILGFIMGFIVLVTDANAFLAINIPATIFICLIKTTLAGVAAGWIYRGLEKKSQWLAIILASIAAPIVNTLVFVSLALPIFYTDLVLWAEANDYTNVISYVFLGMVGVNFLLEFSINAILSPVVFRIVTIFRKKLNKKTKRELSTNNDNK